MYYGRLFNFTDESRDEFLSDVTDFQGSLAANAGHQKSVNVTQSISQVFGKSRETERVLDRCSNLMLFCLVVVRHVPPTMTATCLRRTLSWRTSRRKKRPWSSTLSTSTSWASKVYRSSATSFPWSLTVSRKSQQSELKLQWTNYASKGSQMGCNWYAVFTNFIKK